ncbi:MAG TPA: right-handed parallel beta-helix repeat-containing protein [Phycisphaerales bacterium]|nr:right-handed parallel beta-helix repeat-containing protein [Phycisphaerales bacterium]
MRTLTAIAASLLTVTVLAGGPLNPPAGAVAPSMKPLSEIEPRTAINATNTPGDADSVYRITQPGSYYLTGNLTGANGKCGIEITASFVTIDLNGFAVLGGVGTLDGIRTAGGICFGVTVRNGTIAGFGQDGLDLTHGGISVGGSIQDIHTRDNDGRGIATSASCVVERCSATLSGLSGIVVQYGSTASDCAASTNGGAGLVTSGGCTVTRCTAESNAENGFDLSGGSTITNSSARVNDQHGIQAGTGCLVADCTAQYNGLDGIRITSYVTVRGCNCDSNGLIGVGAGIHAIANDNRIEGNACNNADAGIDVDTSGNVIVRNTCATNMVNWSLAVGNNYGPIIDRSGALSPPVNGNSAAAALGTTDPNANFTH